MSRVERESSQEGQFELADTLWQRYGARSVSTEYRRPLNDCHAQLQETWIAIARDAIELLCSEEIVSLPPSPRGRG